MRKALALTSAAAIALLPVGRHAQAQAIMPPRGLATVGQSVIYRAADDATIVTSGTAITVFAGNEVNAGCLIVNTLPMTLYVDLVTTAAAGSTTSIPVAAGASFACPYPPRGAVSAVAAMPGSFVAVRY